MARQASVCTVLRISNLRSDLATLDGQLSSTKKQLTAAKSNLEDAKQKLSNYQNRVAKDFPLLINSIEIANYSKYPDKVINGYGEMIYSNKSKWVWFRINYEGMSSGSRQFNYRIYDSSGKLVKWSDSPSGYTYSSQVYIYTGKNTIALFGHGSDASGSWSKGQYRIEIWYNDMCLKSKSFNIY